jgi:Yip1-like protein
MSKLVDRTQRILLAPKAEWPVIAAEPDTTAGIFRGYVAILAAISPIAMFVKSTLIGYHIPLLGPYRVDMMDGLIGAIISYGLSLLAVYVFALIVNALAPTFGGQKDSLLALKVTAYSMTAAWIAGVAQILPLISVLIGIAGAAYSVYLLYLGLPVTMKAPADKAVAYTAVVCVAALLLYWIIALIVGGVMGTTLGARSLWGGPTVMESDRFDKYSPLGRLEEWSGNVEEAGKRVEAEAATKGAPSSAAIGQLMGAVVGADTSLEALSTDQIKTYIPATLAGLPRTSVTAERNAALGFQVSEANALYEDDKGRSLRLSLNDTGGAHGLVALAAWAGVEQERSWDSGYERDYRQDGRMMHERWDNATGSGEYGLVVGGRFAIEVSGKAASMDELKAAVASGIDIAALEAIAQAGKKPG